MRAIPCRPFPAVTHQPVAACVLQGDAVRNYTALDADLVGWHADLGLLYEQAASMAIVGQVSSSDLGVEFHFTKQVGAEKRGELGGAGEHRHADCILVHACYGSGMVKCACDQLRNPSLSPAPSIHHAALLARSPEAGLLCAP